MHKVKTQHIPYVRYSQIVLKHSNKYITKTTNTTFYNHSSELKPHNFPSHLEVQLTIWNSLKFLTNY